MGESSGPDHRHPVQVPPAPADCPNSTQINFQLVNSLKKKKGGEGGAQKKGNYRTKPGLSNCPECDLQM